MMQSSRDIPLFITSDASSSERRITPSWTIAQLKAKLEPVTGISPTSQRLLLRTSDQSEQIIEAANEDEVQVWRWPLTEYAEIHVANADPQGPKATPLDPSSVPKYTMPIETYSSLPNTVLAYKKAHHIGRFDPHGPEMQEKRVQEAWKDIEDRKLAVNSRCRVGGSDARRGTIAYIGDVPDIPGIGPWIGVRLDEPVGKHDGSANGKRYFDCGPNSGLFVRTDRIEIGEFAPLGLDDDLGSDMEEI